MTESDTFHSKSPNPKLNPSTNPEWQNQDTHVNRNFNRTLTLALSHTKCPDLKPKPSTNQKWQDYFGTEHFNPTQITAQQKQQNRTI